MREPQKRIIYDNYNLWGVYEEIAREILLEQGIVEPTFNQIWDEIYEQDQLDWDYEKDRLIEFFDGGTWILMGTVGRWNEQYAAGTIFTDFVEMFNRATKDCDYISIYDKNGHLYLRCSHHDGTNLYEIKSLTNKGIKYLENWEENWNDKRTEQYVHNMIVNKYSVLPHFAHRVYGCSKVEYKKGNCIAKDTLHKKEGKDYGRIK